MVQECLQHSGRLQVRPSCGHHEVPELLLFQPLHLRRALPPVTGVALQTIQPVWIGTHLVAYVWTPSQQVDVASIVDQ